MTSVVIFFAKIQVFSAISAAVAAVASKRDILLNTLRCSEGCQEIAISAYIYLLVLWNSIYVDLCFGQNVEGSGRVDRD